jgi:hypothetical protein
MVECQEVDVVFSAAGTGAAVRQHYLGLPELCPLNRPGSIAVTAQRYERPHVEGKVTTTAPHAPTPFLFGLVLSEAYFCGVRLLVAHLFTQIKTACPLAVAILRGRRDATAFARFTRTDGWRSTDILIRLLVPGAALRRPGAVTISVLSRYLVAAAATDSHVLHFSLRERTRRREKTHDTDKGAGPA